MDDVAIAEAVSDADFAAARALFQEYESAIGVDLCFQNFAQELDRLREMYGPPLGGLLLARRGADVVGCVGFRPLHDDVCEMKRLYVRPSARGLHLGRRLAESIMAGARAAGYRAMVLDTLASMAAARGLYRALGFRETTAYYRNPLPEVVYMECALTEGPAAAGPAAARPGP